MRPVIPVNSFEFLGLNRSNVSFWLDSSLLTVLVPSCKFCYWSTHILAIFPRLPFDMTCFRYLERVLLDLFARKGFMMKSMMRAFRSIPWKRTLYYLITSSLNDPIVFELPPDFGSLFFVQRWLWYDCTLTGCQVISSWETHAHSSSFSGMRHSWEGASLVLFDSEPINERTGGRVTFRFPVISRYEKQLSTRASD